MSELKPYIGPHPTDNTLTEYYLKSEADKVIAELKKKLVEQATLRAWAEIQLRHSNHKRCLAMAEWCEATALWCYQAANTLPAGFHATLYGKPVMIEPNRLFNRFVLLNNWSKRWRKLAEKFKEEK